MGSVCVNVRCGFREKSERRDCPKCGWLMLDGPLPATGSIAPPPKVRNVTQIAAVAGAAVVLFLGSIGMVAGSYASSDPVAANHAVAEVAPAIEPIAAAPVATPAPVVVAATPEKPAAAPKAAVAKAVAKKKTPAKAAKKTVVKKTTKKPATKVARR